MPARFFKPSFSQQYVPSYAPLPLDTISKGVDQAIATRQRADKALDLYTAEQDEVLGSLTPQNRVQAAKILDQDSEFIDRLSDPEGDVRYQDMIPLLRRQARKSKESIRPYVEDSSRMKTFQTRVNELYDKGDLDLDVRNYYDRQVADYQGLQFDDQGRPQGFRAPSVVRSIDLDKRIRDFMGHIEMGNEQVLIDEYGADPRFVKEIRQRYLTGEEFEGLQQLITNQLRSDPEVEQYLQVKHAAQNDALTRSGQEPVDFDSFVNRMVRPYAAAEAIPTTTERLRSNPGFSADEMYQNPLSASVMIGSPDSDVMTPGQYHEALGELTENYEGTQERVLNELQGMGVNPRYDSEQGRIIVDNPIADGVDQSPHIAAANAELSMARRNMLHMQQYDDQVRAQAEKATGLRFQNEDEVKYEQQLQDAFDLWGNTVIGGPAGGTSQVDLIKSRGDDPWEEFQKSRVYRKTLEEFSPLYKKYIELFHENAKGGHREVPLATLGGKGDQFMEEYLKKSTPVLQDGKTREVLYDEDINKLAELGINIQDAEYSGLFTDPDTGEFMVAYQAFEEGGTNPRLLLAPAPQGVEQYALQAGMIDELDHYVLSHVRRLSDQPGGSAMSTVIPVEAADHDFGEASMEVRMLPRAEQDPRRGRMYEVIVTSPGGRKSSQYVGSGDAIADGYKNYLRNLLNSKSNGQ